MNKESNPGEMKNANLEESSAPGQQKAQQDTSPKQQYYLNEDEEEKQKSYNSIMFRIKDFWRECLRVLKVTKKPDAVEFKSIVKVSGLGIIIIGLLGFTVQMIKVLFFG